MPAPILITRSSPEAEAFAEQLHQQLGPTCRTVISPLFRIEYLECDLSIPDPATLIFTSRHAVEAYARLTADRRTPCYAVGPATARTARKAGFDPIVAGGTGASLARQIADDVPAQPCLYLRGAHIAFDISQELNSAGIETYTSVVYRQVDLGLTDEAQGLLSGPDPVIVPLFSPRSAALFGRAATGQAPLDIAAMSKNVAQALPELPVRTIIIAKQPDQNAMLQAVSDLWAMANRLEGHGGAQ